MEKQLSTVIPAGVASIFAVILLAKDQYMPAVLSFALACIITASSAFTREFVKEVEREAGNRGGGSARFLFTLIDYSTEAFTSYVSSVARRIASRFKFNYYRRLVYNCRDYETQGLEKYNTFKLQSMYVNLRISPQHPTNVSRSLIGQAETTTPTEKNIGYYLSLIKLEAASRRFVILGPAGSGKTTLLRYIALAFATNRHRRSLHPGCPALVPVLIYLRDFYNEIVEDSDRTLIDLTEISIKRMQTSKPLSPPTGWFADMIAKNKCLYLFDGLDEIAEESSRRLVSRWIDKQLHEYPDLPCILTSRPLGYENSSLKQSITVLEVKPFNLLQIQNLVHYWYHESEIRNHGNQDDLGVRDQATKQAEDLLSRLRENSALMRLATSPLLLTMILTVHQRGSALPGRRVDLYKEICNVLLEKRSRAKGLPILCEQSQSVLQSIALFLMLRNTRKFTYQEVARIVAERLNLVSASPISPHVFIRHLTEVSGIISEREEGVFEFAHLSLQEYLASVEIIESRQESLLIEAVNSPSLTSWWAETIRLYAAQADSSVIVESALASASTTALKLAIDCSIDGKILRSDLRLLVKKTIDSGLEEF